MFLFDVSLKLVWRKAKIAVRTIGTEHTSDQTAFRQILLVLWHLGVDVELVEVDEG